MASQTCYHAEVTLTVTLPLNAHTAEEARHTARRAVGAWPGVKPGDIRDISIHEMDGTQQRRHNNLRTWQELEALSLATAAQRLRWGDGELADSDLLALVRPVFFQSFAGFVSRTKMTASAIPHPTRRVNGRELWTCSDDRVGALPITWITIPNPVMTDRETVMMAQIYRALDQAQAHPWLSPDPGSVSAVPRIHRGTCHVCGMAAAETSALVAVRWAGRIMSKEFAL